MPIVAADLKEYRAVNQPENDADTAGGAIQNPAHANGGSVPLRIIAANDDLSFVSDDAGDTSRTFTVTYRDSVGAIQTEGATSLNGTTPVVTDTTDGMYQVLKVELSAKHATATVTVTRDTGGAPVCTFGPNETTALILLYDSVSESSQKDLYAKTFLVNTDTLTLTSAEIELTAEMAGADDVRIGGAATKDDSGTSTNRVTAPGGVTFVGLNTRQAVPTGQLAQDETIGVWIHVDLAGDNAAFYQELTLKLVGQTVA